MKTPTVSIETVTPEKAAEYLKNNHRNQRNLTSSHMIHLSQQMQAGQWKMNGESIIFDWNGDIADGQHRLHSIVKSGITCDFVIVRGIDPDCFPTIDRGKPRSNGNIFAMHGIANFNIAASATYGVWNYRRALSIKPAKDGKNKNLFGSLNSYIRPSSTDLLHEYETHVDKYKTAIKIAMDCRQIAAPSCVSTVAALAMIDGKKGVDWVELFWSSFKSGANLHETSPILKLRGRLTGNENDKKKFSQNHTILLMAKAWNLYAKEQECKVLRHDADNAFPIE
jgi:DNA gyrase/topoisomerase IV subunit B